jgi:dTMP kinase
MDIRFADNLYYVFCRYQSHLIDQFDLMAKEFNFISVDATQSVNQVFEELKKSIVKLII